MTAANKPKSPRTKGRTAHRTARDPAASGDPRGGRAQTSSAKRPGDRGGRVPTSSRGGDGLDALFKALADGTRREMLDLLAGGPRTTTELVEAFDHLSRFGVMKHLEVLRAARLVISHREGRRRINALNAVPLREIHERWVRQFADHWSGALLDIKRKAERRHGKPSKDSPVTNGGAARRRKK